MRISVIIAAVLLVVGVVASLGASGVQEYQRASQIDQQIAQLQAEADILTRKNALLEDRIAYFASSAYQEYVAKERMGFVLEGERVVAVTPAVLGVSTNSNNSGDINSTSKESTQDSSSWWQAIFGK